MGAQSYGSERGNFPRAGLPNEHAADLSAGGSMEFLVWVVLSGVGIAMATVPFALQAKHRARSSQGIIE